MHPAFAEVIEPRLFLSVSAGAISGDVDFGSMPAGGRSATIATGGGARLSLSLVGPGTGHASATAAGLVIRLDGTTERTTLTVTPDPGAGRVALAGLDVRGSLGRFVAPAADLAGDVSVSGSLRQAFLGDAPGATPVTVRIGPGQRTALRLGRVKDLSIDAPAVGFALIAAAAWDDDPANGRSAITAGSVSRLSVGGSASFELHADRIGSVTVAGDLVDSRVLVLPRSPEVRQGIASLAVGGAMRGVWVNTLADIGSVSARGMFDSTIMAGVAYVETAPGAFEQPLPVGAVGMTEGFTGRYGIRSVTVTNRTSQTYAFQNSRVSAYRVSSVKLDDVAARNDGRPSGVSAYYLGRLLRRFGGSDASLTFLPNPATDFVVHQVARPLVFRPEPDGGYGGYHGGYAAISVVDNIVDFNTGAAPPVLVGIPAAGLQVGSVANHPSATGVFLNPDGTYDVRDAAGSRLVAPAPLADVILAVAASPGVTMKVEVKPRTPTSVLDPSVGRDGSLTFLSTSAGAEVVIPDPATPVRYQGMAPAIVPGSFEWRTYTVPDKAALVSAMAAAGTAVQEFTRPLLRLRDGGVEVARVFDDLGLRRVRALTDHTFAMTDEAGAVVAAGADLGAVLFGGGPWLGGHQRTPAWMSAATPKVTIQGLARGGTAVYEAAGEQSLDAAGGVSPLPSLETLREWMRVNALSYYGVGA